MKSEKKTNSNLDIIDLRQVKFYLFINDSSFEFIKVVGIKSTILLDKTEFAELSENALANYFKNLSAKGFLFGQPISIILNISSTYTYIKKVQGTNLTELQNSVKHFSDNSYDIKFSISDLSKTKLFIYQAVKKELINNIIKSCEEQQINITEINTLPIVLLSSSKNLTDTNSLHSYDLFNHIHYILNTKNNILYLQYRQNEVHKLADSIFSSDKYKKYEQTNSAVTLSKSNNKLVRKLSYITKQSKRSQYLHTIHNSIKLLTRIASLIFVLLLASTLVSSLLSSESEIISEFQQKYQAKQILQNQIDSLQSSLAQSNKNRPITIQTASIISMFCQNSYNKLHLTKITINNNLEDSVLVETKGSAKNEDLIFKYQKACMKYTDPLRLSLNSIKPIITNSRGFVDTNIIFSLSMVVQK